MSAFAELETLSQTLGLINEPQDWGIVNSDPNRAEEFMLYAHRSPITFAQQYAIVELVLSSVNDAMTEGLFSPEMQCSFEKFLDSDLHGLGIQINYWKNLNSEDEYPVSKFLKSHYIH